jgi:hypothetical protein
MIYLFDFFQVWLFHNKLINKKNFLNIARSDKKKKGGGEE